MNKILVISNLYPSETDPTYGTFVWNFVHELENADKFMDVDLCVIRGRTNFKLIKLLKYVVFYIKSVFLLSSKKYDLVYVHYITLSSIGLRIVSFFKNIPIAFNIHGDDLLTKSKFANSILRFIKPLLFKSKLIVVPSNYFKMVLLDKFPCLDSSNIFISASGGVKDTFYTLKEISNEPTTSLRLGYVSRIDEGKGWDIFCNAVGKLVNMGINVHGVIAGGGGQVELLKSKIVSMNLTNNISYLGAVEQNKLSNLYSSIDLFVFPTLLRESLGLVGLEAMASFTPVIGSDLGGLKSFIQENYNGYLYEAGNSDELCIKILKYLNLTDLEKKIMGDNARKTAMKYKSDLVSTALVNKIKNRYNL